MIKSPTLFPKLSYYDDYTDYLLFEQIGMTVLLDGMFISYVHTTLQFNTWDLVLFLTKSMKFQQMLDCAHCAENC